MPEVATLTLNPTFSQRLAGLAPAQRMRLALGIGLLVVVGIVGIMMWRQAEWRVRPPPSLHFSSTPNGPEI